MHLKMSSAKMAGVCKTKVPDANKIEPQVAAIHQCRHQNEKCRHNLSCIERPGEKIKTIPRLSY